MRIGLNLLYLLPGEVGGVETYGLRLIGALTRVDARNEYVAFANGAVKRTDTLKDYGGEVVWCPIEGHGRVARYGWEQLVLPAQSAMRGIDILHSLSYVGPARPITKTVLSIPDVNFRRIRSHIPASRRAALEFFCCAAAKSAAAVVTISEFSKQEIIAQLGVPGDKIHVTLPGPGWVDTDTVAPNGELPVALNLPSRYFSAFGGGGSAHKNIEAVLNVASDVYQRSGIPFVIIGNMPKDLNGSARAASPPCVIQVGHIPRTAAMTVLKRSLGLVVPSLYEGFGLPVAEAQTMGVPVVCSSSAALPEVAGDAALFFDPHSPEQLVDALMTLATEEGVRERLSALGRINAARFDWEATARQTIAVYESVA